MRRPPLVGAGRGRRGFAALAALVASGAVGLGVLVGLPAPAVAADPPAFSQTRTLTREHLEPDGSTTQVDTRTVTVQVDRTTNLQGRERIAVSWSGARPTAGRSADPYGVNGIYQEYPVVILQCRGVENPAAGQEQLSRETCWTTVAAQRFGQAPVNQAAWTHDRYASEADRAPQSQDTAWPDACLRFPDAIFRQHRLPFRAADGTVHQFCDELTQAPESGIDSAFPPAEIAASTQADGTGEVAFEVRTATENESLGCGYDVPCSLVVIPIMGLSCADTNAACRADGISEPGSIQPVYGAADVAVTAAYWWSESNWRNRYVVPLSFALPPDACDVLDSRAPVPLYGSELLDQASLQWAPAYCLRADRFKYQQNFKGEAASLRLLAKNEAVAALVSEPASPDDPTVASLALGYAPVAVTGWGIAFVSDLPDNGGELREMRLTPRLIAKLLTQSYPGSAVGRQRPGLEDNPLSLNLDPEFVALNPGLSTIPNEAMATLASLSDASDVMTSLTSYVASDPAAMAFVAGEADPWGMTVNPAYEDIALPRAEWPLLDTYVPTFLEGDCRKTYFTTPYLSLIASPVNSVRKVAQAMIDAWPFVSTRCEAVPGQAAKVGRVTRQSYGGRNMVGLVTLADAARYGLRTAELQAVGSGDAPTFVGATDEAMAAAIGVAAQTAPGAAYVIDEATLPAGAYPGTMIVHAAARLSGLPATDAAHVAQFVTVATTEGQVRGPLNGQLPEGYLPILASGETAALHASAQLVAAAVVRQDGTVVPATPSPSPSPTVPPAPPPTPPRTAPAVASPPAVDGGDGGDVVQGLPADTDVEAQVTATGSTQVQRSAAANNALPVALGASLAGVLGAPLLRRWSTRRRLP